MKTKRILLILFVICITFSACDATIQKSSSLKKFQYSISATFSETDTSSFENRLSVCELDIVEHSTKNEEHYFVLYSSHRWDEDCLKLLGQNFEAYVVDEDGNTLVTGADVLQMQYSNLSLDLTLSADLSKKLQEECDTRTLSLVVDGSITNAAAYFDNAERLSFAIPREDGPADLYKAVIAFSKAPLTEEIEIEVLPLK